MIIAWTIVLTCILLGQTLGLYSFFSQSAWKCWVQGNAYEIICWEPRDLVLLPKANPFIILGSLSLFVNWESWSGWFLGSFPILNPRANCRLIKRVHCLTVYMPFPQCNLLSYLWHVTCTYDLAVYSLKNTFIFSEESHRREWDRIECLETESRESDKPGFKFCPHHLLVVSYWPIFFIIITLSGHKHKVNANLTRQLRDKRYQVYGAYIAKCSIVWQSQLLQLWKGQEAKRCVFQSFSEHFMICTLWVVF